MLKRELCFCKINELCTLICRNTVIKEYLYVIQDIVYYLTLVHLIYALLWYFWTIIFYTFLWYLLIIDLYLYSSKDLFLAMGAEIYTPYSSVFLLCCSAVSKVKKERLAIIFIWQQLYVEYTMLWELIHRLSKINFHFIIQPCKIYDHYFPLTIVINLYL